MRQDARFDLRQLLSLLAVLLLTPALRLFPSGAVRLAGRAAVTATGADLVLELEDFLVAQYRLLSVAGHQAISSDIWELTISW